MLRLFSAVYEKSLCYTRVHKNNDVEETKWKVQGRVTSSVDLSLESSNSWWETIVVNSPTAHKMVEYHKFQVIWRFVPSRWVSLHERFTLYLGGSERDIENPSGPFVLTAGMELPPPPRHLLLLCPDVTIFRSRICMCLRAKTELPEIRECGAITHSLPSSSVCPPAPPLHASHRQTATSRTSRSREISEANPTGTPLAFHKSTAPSIRMTSLLLVAHSSFRRALFPVYPLMPNLDN